MFPNHLTIFLSQKATLWTKGGFDGFGQPTFGAPITIPVRWEERSEYLTNTDGVLILSRARVFLDRPVELGDYLLLGEDSTSDPRGVDKAFAVIDYRSTPDLSGQIFERKCYL